MPLDPFWAAIASAVTTYGGTKLIDHWLARGKARADERSGAMAEVKDVWARLDKVENDLEASKLALANEREARREAEEKALRFAQRLTPLMLEVEHYRRQGLPAPPPIITIIPPEPPALPPGTPEETS